MNRQDFNNLVDEQLKVCKALLDVKGEEYTHASDRLLSFKTASHILHKTPIQALGGQLAKHTVSLFELIEKDSKDLDLWQEKISDSMCYLLLLKALLWEAHN